MNMADGNLSVYYTYGVVCVLVVFQCLIMIGLTPSVICVSVCQAPLASCLRLVRRGGALPGRGRVGGGPHGEASTRLEAAVRTHRHAYTICTYSTQRFQLCLCVSLLMGCVMGGVAVAAGRSVDRSSVGGDVLSVRGWPMGLPASLLDHAMVQVRGTHTHTHAQAVQTHRADCYT